MGSLAPIHWLMMLMCGGIPLFFVFALGRLLWNKGGQTKRPEPQRENPPQDSERPVSAPEKPEKRPLPPHWR